MSPESLRMPYAHKYTNELKRCEFGLSFFFFFFPCFFFRVLYFGRALSRSDKSSFWGDASLKVEKEVEARLRGVTGE